MNQKKGGHFVCKFFETFTLTSIKFLAILKIFWNKIEVIKPLTSRPSNSEKYYVCMDFKYNDNGTDKEYKEYSKKLLEILKEIHEEQKLKIVDLFSEYFPDNNFLKNIIDLNVKIENENFKAINEIISFINAQNFYGDTYQMNRQKQINAAKFWISYFFPKDNNLNKARSELKKYFSFNT